MGWKEILAAALLFVLATILFWKRYSEALESCVRGGRSRATCSDLLR